MNADLLNLLSALPKGSGGEAGELMALAELLKKNKNGGKPDAAQLLTLLSRLEQKKPQEEAETLPSPCASCREPCVRAGLALPPYEKARDMARLWYGY